MNLYGISSDSSFERRIEITFDGNVNIFALNRKLSNFWRVPLSVNNFVSLIESVENARLCSGLPLHHLNYLKQMNIGFEIQHEWRINLLSNQKTQIRSMILRPHQCFVLIRIEKKKKLYTSKCKYCTKLLCSASRYQNYHGKENSPNLSINQELDQSIIAQSSKNEIILLRNENQQLRKKLEERSSSLSLSDSDYLVLLVQRAVAAGKLPDDCFTRELFSSVLEALVTKVYPHLSHALLYFFSLKLLGSASNTLARSCCEMESSISIFSQKSWI